MVFGLFGLHECIVCVKVFVSIIVCRWIVFGLFGLLCGLVGGVCERDRRCLVMILCVSCRVGWLDVSQHVLTVSVCCQARNESLDNWGPAAAMSATGCSV